VDLQITADHVACAQWRGRADHHCGSIVLKLQVASYGRAADLARSRLRRNILYLQVPIDHGGWTDGERASALDLDISTNGYVADRQTAAALGDVTGDAAAYKNTILTVCNIQIAFEVSEIGAIAAIAGGERGKIQGLKDRGGEQILAGESGVNVAAACAQGGEEAGFAWIASEGSGSEGPVAPSQNSDRLRLR
jgi:hypothetical protein